METLTRLPVDDDPAVTVAVEIATLLDDNGFIAPRLALVDNGALMHAVAIVIDTAAPDGHAGTHRSNANADADFFRARGHGTQDSDCRDGGHCKTFHVSHAPQVELLEGNAPSREWFLIANTRAASQLRSGAELSAWS
ncbi:MAG TPA: hypothetical protein VE865_01680 [Bradyrhizobium sp.]|nr:hypothetical protein [Bradyrhizobium sp.]